MFKDIAAECKRKKPSSFSGDDATHGMFDSMDKLYYNLHNYANYLITYTSYY